MAKTTDDGAGTEVSPVGKPSFEDALGELEGIVQKLERGQLDLESSIAAYERGTELRRWCDTRLGEARMRVEKLTFDKDGEPRDREPFEPT